MGLVGEQQWLMVKELENGCRGLY